MIRVLFITLYTAFNLFLQVHALDLNEISQRLNESSIKSGKFSQIKTNRHMKRVIRSSGEITIINDVGIIWKNLEPIFFAKTYQLDKVVTWKNESGQLKSSVSKKIIDKVFSKIMLSIVTGDIAYLENNFGVSIKQDGFNSPWLIMIKATNKKIAKRIDVISIMGDDFIHSIKFRMHSDMTIILDFYEMKGIAEITQEDCDYLTEFEYYRKLTGCD